KNRLAIIFKNAHTRWCDINPCKITRRATDIMSPVSIGQRTGYHLDMGRSMGESNRLHDRRDPIFSGNQRSG
ncbi:hypothetical protein UA70_16550, partial [Raoultella planticola]